MGIKREIKFRFWGNFRMFNDEDEKCMLYGDTFAFDDYEPINDLFKMKDTIVIQYTGLVDKKSQEIYEGDKLRDFMTDVIVTVEFIDGSFCVTGYEKFAVDLLEYLENSSSSTYVVGNIYEDKE